DKVDGSLLIVVNGAEDTLVPSQDAGSPLSPLIAEGWYQGDVDELIIDCSRCVEVHTDGILLINTGELL
ncbi:unnamed protein product, partial [Adineta ricciae]